MKHLFLIEDTIVNKISYYHLVAFLIALPFDFFYSEIILISFGIHSLIHLKKDKLISIFSWPVFIPVSIYLLGLVTIVYSPDKPEAISVVTKQLAIFLLPILFAITGLDLVKYRSNLIVIFGSAITCTILYLYVDAIRTIFYFDLPLSSLFTLTFMNHGFSLPIEIHATYLSAYTAFALLYFVYLALSKPGSRYKWVYIIFIAILSAGMLQLSSRAVFIAFLLLLNLALPFFFPGKKRWAIFIAATLLSVTTLTGINSMDSFKTRYISELRTDLTNDVKIIENIEPRLARWNVIMDLAKRSPVFGYGTGSEKELLKKQYFENGLYISYLNEFNTHNEYLSILIKMGLIGLALFLYILYFGFAVSIQHRDIAFLNFMVIIAVVSMSENILDLNKGIFFYSFFFSLFLRSSYAAEKKTAAVLPVKTALQQGHAGNPEQALYV